MLYVPGLCQQKISMFYSNGGYNVFMSQITPNSRIAQFMTPDGPQDLKVRSDHGSFASHAEAEAKAKELADAADRDTVIIQGNDGSFHVYGIDEVHSLLPGGTMSSEVRREAPIVSFVATDPLSGEEKVMGRSASAPAQNAPRELPPTVLDRFLERFGSDIDDDVISGPQELAEVNQLIRQLEMQGMKVTLEMDDDIFEDRDKFEGFKSLLHYAQDNLQALQMRSIKEISVIDEWDVFWSHTDLEYNKKTGVRTLEVGDQFLRNWNDDAAESVSDLNDELGETLSDSELSQRSEVFRDIRQDLTQSFDEINRLQQSSVRGETRDPEAAFTRIESRLKRLEEEVIPQAEDVFDDLSIRHERKLSQRYLETFSETTKALRHQMEELRAQNEAGLSELEFNARLEKLKLLLVRGVNEIPESRNYFGAYASGLGQGGEVAPPSVGLEYSRTMGQSRNTVASLRAGTTAPLKAMGGDSNDIMLGMGVSHRFSSRNHLLDGANVGVGVGFSRDVPFFIGASASNNWYLNDYHALEGEWSAVGNLHASVGTYSNVGAMLNVHKQVTDRIDFEGYGEISFWNQAVEAEGEFAMTQDKDFYLTGGVGTNKLLYAGLGFADKYEVEVGLGGASLGKDSNNLPGESSWEVGVRMFPLPMPYFRHQRVPGYQFTYHDDSRQFITPNGSFMTIKQDANGEDYRQAYIPDADAPLEENQIVYRQVRSREELAHLDSAPTREISIGPLGYITVVDNGETIIEDGLIRKNLTEAEMGIITDQAGVLWFDRIKADESKVALNARRGEMPLPLYRAVHY